jgi:hypothetical protein
MIRIFSILAKPAGQHLRTMPAGLNNLFIDKRFIPCYEQ